MNIPLKPFFFKPFMHLSQRRISMKIRSLGLVCSASLMLSCQMSPELPQPSVPEAQAPVVVSALQAAAPAKPVVPRVINTPKQAPFGQLKALGDQKLAFNITFPDNTTLQEAFRTQAFSCGEVAFAQIQVNGPGLANTVYADGSDGQNMINATGCNVSGTLSNIPYGKLVVSLKLYDADRTLISGASLTSGIAFDENTNTLEMSFRQTNVGQVLSTLLEGSLEDELLTNSIDLDALQSFFETVTNVSGSFPGYTFTTHPALVNITQVVNDLKANGGDVSQLNPADTVYQVAPGEASFNLQGVLDGQSVSASIDDAISADATINANGQVTITNLPPGTWRLRLSGTGYIDQVVMVTVNADQTTDLGTLTILAPAPTLTSIAPTQAVSGQSITLTGTNFNGTDINNTVTIGGLQATVTAASPTSLTVTVPNGLAVGPQPVIVAIGESAPSDSVNLNVVQPTLTSLNVTEQTIGNSITLTGTNFNTTDINNTVTFGGTAATVTNATATSLTVTVPDGIFGTVNVQVKNLNSPLSNSLSFAVTPRIDSFDNASGSTGDSIVLTGSGFNPTAANNTVTFGGTNAVVSAATTTALTVTLPERPAGAANATVQVGTPVSSALSFTFLPRLSTLSTGKTFNSKPALIREEVLTLTGTNFSLTPANNIVNFGGGITAAATMATATQLTVTIPGTLGTAGDVNVSVTTNSQLSNTLLGVVPTINVNFTGGFQ
jgi:hypothetical protein